MVRRPKAVVALYLAADGTENDATEHEAFFDARQEAEVLVNDHGKRQDMIHLALQLAQKLGPDCYRLIEMAEMHFKGVRTLSRTEMLTILGCLAYIVNPFDAIPDAIILGLSDDLAVLSMAVYQLKGSIADYQKWKDDNLDVYQHGKEDVQCQTSSSCIIL